MTETAFLQYTGYVLAFFAVWIVARCARSMLSERYVPEVWGYLELPDGTSRAIEHWECILGRAKASDIVLTGEGIERSHAAIQRSGAGEWTLSALDGGRGVWLNGKAVTGDAPLRGGDTLKLGEMELHFFALDDAQRATLQRKRPLTGHKEQPAVTLLLLVCFQLVLLFQFVFTTDGAALAYIVLSFGLLIAMEWFCYFVMRSISVRGFEPETLAFFLTSVGFSVVGSSAPDGMGRHCLLFLAALALFFALGVWLRDLHRVRAMRWPMAFAALGFLALNLLLSETIWGAKNWLSIAGQTLQPSEFVKIAYVYAGAATLDRLFRRRTLIRFIAYSAVCVGALALMGDFGTALVFFVCFLVISFMRSGSFATLFLAIGGAALAVMLVLTVKPYVAQRFATWGHAWEDPLNRLSAGAHHVRDGRRRSLWPRRGSGLAQKHIRREHRHGVRRRVRRAGAHRRAVLRALAAAARGVLRAQRGGGALFLLRHRLLRHGHDLHGAARAQCVRLARSAAVHGRDVPVRIEGRVEPHLLLGHARVYQGRRHALRRQLCAAHEL